MRLSNLKVWNNLNYQSRIIEILRDLTKRKPGECWNFQVKSSQRFLLQQNKYHTYNNIRDWNPFGFICLLKYIHYSYRAWPHFGDNKVSTGASTEAKRSPKGTGPPPQAALESFHAENLQYSLWQQGWPHDDNHVPVHNNDAKHVGVKIPQSIHNTGKYATCLSVQSLWLQQRICDSYPLSLR